MYVPFNVADVILDIKTKRIYINLSSDVDPKTINESTVCLTERLSKKVIEYKHTIKFRQIVLELLDWPTPNIEYVLKVSQLKNVIGDEIQSNFRKIISFKSSVLSTVDVIYPAHGEVITDVKIKLNEKAPSENDVVVNEYFVEISKDCNFFSDIRTYYFKERQEINIIDLPSGQYYLRARAQKGKIDEESLEYGLWSETISFIVTAKEEQGTQPDIPPSDELDPTVTKILKVINASTTKESILIEFNKPINAQTLANLLIIKRKY